MQEAINNDFWATLAKAEDRFYSAEEKLNEMESEYRGECYAFGDGAFGACVAIADQEILVRYRQRVYETLEAQMTA
jgi:hypothetical protein